MLTSSLPQIWISTGPPLPLCIMGYPSGVDGWRKDGRPGVAVELLCFVMNFTKIVVRPSARLWQKRTMRLAVTTLLFQRNRRWQSLLVVICGREFPEASISITEKLNSQYHTSLVSKASLAFEQVTSAVTQDSQKLVLAVQKSRLDQTFSKKKTDTDESGLVV